MIGECLILFFLILLNAFFALSEMAIVSASKPILRQLASEGNRRAQAALLLAQDSGRFLSTVQVGITLVGIVSGVYGGATIADKVAVILNKYSFISPHGHIIAMVVVVGTITFLSVVIGELVPKQLAIKYADDLAMFVARPMTLLSKICTPVVISFERAARLLLRILGVIDANETPMTQYEIKAIISEGKASGLFEQEENLMLHSVMDLSDIMVEKVMTHRKNIEMIDSSLPVTEIVDLALTSPYTRLPLYQDQPENIVGVLHTKILARQLRGFEADRPTIDLSAAISEAWFIPETTTLLDQLKAFRTRKEHFALVVDEYGSLLGLITREDILEEIVGQMDEGDETDAPSVQANTTNSTIIVDGEKTIRELNREFEWSLPDDDYATIAGLILYESRTLPEVGQSFVFYNFQFDILERHRHQITSIRITRI
jgi:CBS domain containing-hemolysin-like protein